MSEKWEDFINGIVDDAGVLAKAELINLIKGAKNDSEEFIKRQAEKTERYISQLAEGKIDTVKFTKNMTDIRDLTEMQALKLSVAAKARAQRLAAGISDLIIKGLVSLI